MNFVRELFKILSNPDLIGDDDSVVERLADDDDDGGAVEDEGDSDERNEDNVEIDDWVAADVDDDGALVDSGRLVVVALPSRKFS